MLPALRRWRRVPIVTSLVLALMLGSGVLAWPHAGEGADPAHAPFAASDRDGRMQTPPGQGGGGPVDQCLVCQSLRTLRTGLVALASAHADAPQSDDASLPPVLAFRDRLATERLPARSPPA